VADYQKKIDQIIDCYNENRLVWEQDGLIPSFEPVE